ISRPPAPAKRWTRTRIIGHVLVAFWAALIIGLLLDLYAAWDIVLIQTYGPKYWQGLVTTLTLVFSSIIFGAILSVPVAFGRMTKNKIGAA
ncbi:hypothetical protein LXJ58_36505, partial [Escherichia coli]|nr:hypothetical protein [Escherichia coli]